MQVSILNLARNKNVNRVLERRPTWFLKQDNSVFPCHRAGGFPGGLFSAFLTSKLQLYSWNFLTILKFWWIWRHVTVTVISLIKGRLWSRSLDFPAGWTCIMAHQPGLASSNENILLRAGRAAADAVKVDELWSFQGYCRDFSKDPVLIDLAQDIHLHRIEYLDWSIHPYFPTHDRLCNNLPFTECGRRNGIRNKIRAISCGENERAACPRRHGMAQLHWSD
jgi:hypothetical protein